MKNAIMKVTYVLNGLHVLPYFIAVLFDVDRNWLLMKILTTVLLLKSELPRQFQRFNESVEMLKISWISKNLN